MLAAILLGAQTPVNAQSSNSPWGGPRCASVPVTQILSQWINDHGILPNKIGEWVTTDYTYMERDVWMVIITWGTGGIGGETLGRQTLLIKNNGAVIG